LKGVESFRHHFAISSDFVERLVLFYVVSNLWWRISDKPLLFEGEFQIEAIKSFWFSKMGLNSGAKMAD
jgi:hypothetical protein